MKVSRLNRIFEHGSSRFLGVAIEENFFDSHDILSGMHALQVLMEAGPNVVLVSPAQAATWQAVSPTAPCALIVNVDESASEKSLELALRLDAAGVRVKPGSPSRKSSPSRQLARLKEGCERYGMPLIVELPRSKSAAAQSATIRDAVVLGADIIQVNAEDACLSYEAMTKCAAGVPVVVSEFGGGSDRAVLKQAETLVKNGVRGIVLNRATLNTTEPRPITNALKAIVHQGSNAANAAKILKSL